jgi:hypothetical protein
LKLRVEEKEKTILQLMMNSRRNGNGKDEFLRNIEGNKNEKSEIKIVVNEPRKGAEG